MLKVSVISTLLFTALLGQAHAEHVDHPLFAGYPNAEIERYERIDYDQFALPNGPAGKNDQVSKLTVQGEVTRHSYDIKETSSLQLAKNYQQAAEKAGFSWLFKCEGAACGDSDGEAIGNQLAIHDNVYNYHSKPYYFLGKKDTPQGPVYVAWYIGTYETDTRVSQVIVQSKPLNTDLIQVNVAGLKASAEPTQQADADDLALDHPLLSRYPGAELERHEKVDTETFTLPMPGKQPLSLQGDLARHSYDIKQVSTLKVFENYQQALQKAGFSHIVVCKLTDCGDDEAMQKVGDALALQGDVYNFHSKPYYLVSKLTAGGQDHYVALYIGAYESDVRVHQVIISTKAVQTDLVKADASELKRQLETAGKALIYGIYFDTGKAEVKPESKAALTEIAKLLTQNASLKLYVVGHTDDTGNSQANQQLSEQRAQAVVKALTGEFKISASRLEAHGVGPFAPASNNTSAAGKQLNRRVELVQKL